MPPTTIRKAIGAVKDTTSIGIAKVASNNAPELDVAIVKATSHDVDPADEKYIREILNLTSCSRGYAFACVSAVSKRLGKTRDWIVALKALVLVHRLLNEGDPLLQEEIMYATKKGTRLLDMSGFRDEAHSSSWDHSAFVCTYAMYLDQRLELMHFERKSSGGGGSNRGNGEDRYGGRDNFRSPPPRYGNGEGGYGGRGNFRFSPRQGYGEDRYGDRDNFQSPPRRHGYGEEDRYGCRDNFQSPPRRPNGFDYGDSRSESGYGNYDKTKRSRSFGDMSDAMGREGREEKRTVTPLKEMKPERIFGKMGHLQRVLDRLLSCRPRGLARNERLVMFALYNVVKESFQLYKDISDVLAVLLDRFFDMEYPDCVKVFDAFVSAAKQIDELIAIYNWCKDTGLARTSEYPEVQRIASKLLETLEEFVRDRAKKSKSPERKEEVPPVVKEEPAGDVNEIKALPPPENYTPPPPEPEPKPKQPQVITGDLVDLRDGNVTADDQGNKLALALFNAPPPTGNGSWEAFPLDGQPKETSAWQTTAAEPGRADWELALVESASNLSRQRATMGGGLHPLLLDGMYDQAMVRQHGSTAQLSVGSASSVSLPGIGKTTTPVLALPAPDGTVQAVNQDPFAASLSIPPPSYVQISDMERKQHLLVQEQQVWQQYASNGMQGQTSLAKLSPHGSYTPVSTPFGMPPVNDGMGPPAGYYYTTL
ncbi:hypothetical protein SLA2020_004740 [Shorea laevis]